MEMAERERRAVQRRVDNIRRVRWCEENKRHGGPGRGFVFSGFQSGRRTKMIVFATKKKKKKKETIVDVVK